MELEIRRRPSANGNTFGQLFVDGSMYCYTLEDQIREDPGQPVENWKVDGATAIPSGRYRVTLEDSPKFGPETITINDVPGFQEIRIHSGESVKDTRGCPLVGNAIDPAAGTIHGGLAAGVKKRLVGVVRTAIGLGDNVYVTITNP